MRSFIRKFLAYFVFAAFFSFIINMLLLVPMIYTLQTYDKVLASRSTETLFMLTIMLAIALVVMGLLEYVRSRLLVIANNAIDATLAPYLFHKMVAGATSPEGNQYPHGLKDLATIKAFLTGNAIFAIFDAPWMPVYLVILWFVHPLLFWVAAVGGLLMVMLTAISEFATRSPLESANITARFAGNFVAAGMRNAEVVKAMGMQQGLTRRWGELNQRTVELQTLASSRAGKISSVTKFVRQFLQSVMLGTGAWLVITTGSITAGFMMVANLLMGKALSPIEHIIASWKMLLEARTAYSRLDVFIKGLAQEQAPMELPAPTGQLTLEKVAFVIRALNKVILKEVSFSLAAGESVGIIGPSAAGKSSLARIVTGVWKPSIGTVRLDGADLESWQKESIGQYIGYLPQDVELFAGTIAENIARLGIPDSEQVIAAARLAGVHDMILRLPEGYDTEIGDAGTVLSGGQRQRIGLARALFGNPKLVVLDEPNASLDEAGELALLQGIAHLKKNGATVIIITHKVSLLANVDKLLIMQEGTVAVFGPRAGVLAHIAKKNQEQKDAAAAKVNTDKSIAALEAPNA